MTVPNSDRPQIERLKISNYRVLRNVEFKELTPLTVLLGPNGSGKSTVFDVFAFLHEAFTTNLRQAWEQRGGMAELRSRGSSGSISIEITYREPLHESSWVYLLVLDEKDDAPVVARESFHSLANAGVEGSADGFSFARGEGWVVADATGESTGVELDAPDVLGVEALGQFAAHPRVAALRRFISGWHLYDFNYANAYSSPTPMRQNQQLLSDTSVNLPNVIRFLSEQHPDRLDEILWALRGRVPQLERIDTTLRPDGKLMLSVKDIPFEQSIPSEHASAGTLKLLAYLTVLYDPKPPPIFGIEEPENFLHPRLLPVFAEEIRGAAERAQLLVTTHSPYFVDALRPEELWALYRDESGYTQTARASELPGLMAMVEAGGVLGELWMEGYFDVGDPLTRSGRPR